MITMFKKWVELRESVESRFIKKKVIDLKPGDIMSSTGAIVIWAGQTMETPKGKKRVDLKYPNGRESTSYWGAHTEVGVRKA